MDHSALLLLAIGTMMLIAIGVQIISKQFKLPYTVLLVIAGILIVPLTKIPAFDYLTLFKLTPHLLFYIFLPILLFEAAYNMRLTKVLADVKIISLLAVFGLIVSTVSVAFISSYLLKLFGIDIPFMVLLLFGALISATDPVAVLALFKEYGVPGRLSLIFEGESLFNDATSVALFFVILDVIRVGAFGTHEFIHGFIMFFTMMVGGAIAGIIFGLGFSKMLQFVDGDAKSQITITMLVAHVTFILTEFFHIIPFGNIHIHLSPIVATVIAAMIVGNYGRYKIRKNVEEYMDKFWDYFAFISNSLVFLLLGLLFVNIEVSLKEIIIPVGVIIVAVAISRVIAVYSAIIPFNMKFRKTKQEIPRSWSYLLSWGSLRGSLAIIMVLMIPDDLTVVNWPLEMSVKNFILIVTIGCIYFTLFFKATTIPKAISRLKLDKFTDLDEVRYLEGKAYYYAMTIMEVNKSINTKTLGAKVWNEIGLDAKEKYDSNMKKIDEIIERSSSISEDTLLHRYAVGIERRALEELYISGEISEYGYKKLINKLYVQEDRIEEGHKKAISFSSLEYVDVTDSIITFIRKAFFFKEYQVTNYDKLMYYRALAHIAQAVLKELEEFVEAVYEDGFAKKEVTELQRTYKKYRKQSIDKMSKLLDENEYLMDKYNNLLMKKIKYLQKGAIDKMYHNELLSQRTYFKILNELKKDS